MGKRGAGRLVNGTKRRETERRKKNAFEKEERRKKNVVEKEGKPREERKMQEKEGATDRRKKNAGEKEEKTD